MNKFMIFGGLALAAILIVENIITSSFSYVFIYSSKSWILSFVSIIIGIVIGIGVKGYISDAKRSNQDEDDSYDF